MNHIYRLVWNRKRGVLQVASELARGRTKCGGRSAEGGTRRAVWLSGVPLSLPLLAFAATPSPGPVTAKPAFATSRAVASSALPTGGQVTSGAGQLAERGDTLTITQQSHNLSLEWQTFNIGSQSTVSFVQPDAGAIAVNRIADTGGSQIFGHLNANGQVFLINPNGVLFGRSAQVNVGGLVASTLDVNDGALGGGSLTFSGAGKGRVTNLGTINITGGGFAALLGRQVSNQGAIHAQLGSVALAGGSAVTLDFSGNKLVGVRVDESVLDALAQNGQLIEADGGNVWMTAGARDSLLASTVNNTGTIEARTVENKNGHIVLLGGMDAGDVTVSGTLDASAPNGGNGGEIETSGAKVSVAAHTRITTAASLGLSGTWLIDPNDFTIAPGKTGTVTSGVPSGDISGATLNVALVSGNVVIQSSEGSTSGTGNINVDDAVSWSSHTLTLDAQNNINVNATMTASGSASLALNYGGTNGSSSTAPTAGTSIDVGLGGSGFAPQVNFTGSNTLSINGNTYTLISSSAALQSMTTSGNYALAGNLSLSGSFTPIGTSTTPFSGVFDGLGHTISGLTITNSSATDVGLFGMSSGTIRNVGLQGGGVSGTGIGASIGELAGENSGSISNAFTTGTAAGAGSASSGGGEWVGGLVGKNDASGTITNAFAKGAVTGSSYFGDLGGLVGTNYGSIRNAYATGAVSGSYGGTGGAADSIGGLVGYNTGSIQNAYATGSAEWISGGTSNGNFIGGLVGSDSNQPANATGTITDAYATGRVSVPVPDSSDQLGGLVGSITAGAVNVVTASYWDKDTTGQSSATSSSSSTTAGMTGLTDTQMMQPANYSWTIATSAASSDIWRIYSGSTTPLLESLLTPLKITASNQTVTYNGTNQDTAVLSYSLASPDLSAITLGLTTAQHAGSHLENVASAYSTSYDLSFGASSATLTVSPATLTPTLTNGGVTKTYDGTTAAPTGFTPTYSYSGLIVGDTGATLTDTGAAYDSAHVAGATDVTVSGLGISGITGSNGSLAGDYTLASSSASAAATITPAALSVSLSNVTNITKTYDGTTAAPSGFSPTYVITGLVSGDSATVSSPAAAVFNSAHVASATAITQGGLSLSSITGNGSDNSVLGDYVLASTTAATAGGVASITPTALTPTLINSNVTKTYDGTTAAPAGFTPAYSFTGLVSGDTAAGLTNTGVAYDSAHAAGASALTVSGLSISSVTGTNGSRVTDYSLSTNSESVPATITPATLTPTLTNSGVTKTYDGTTAAPGGFAPTYSLGGLVSGDTGATLADTGVAYDSAHVASATDITVSGLSISGIIGSDGSQTGDYALASSSASVAASIAPLALTATAPTIGGTTTKVYDGTAAAIGATLSGGSVSGALSGDSLSLDTSGIVLDYNSIHVATATSIGASGSLRVNISSSTNGSQSTDYSVAPPSITSVAASITPATLTPTLTDSGVTKSYDGTTAAPAGFTPTYSLTGLVSGDTGASLTDTSAAYNSAHVLGATGVTVSGLRIGGITGSNGSQATDYTLASSSASLAATITPAPLTVSLSNVTNVTKTYDGTTAAPAGFAPTYRIAGLVSGDSATVSSSATPAFDSAHVAAATAITQGGLSLASIAGNGSDNSVPGDYALSSTTASTGAGVASITPATLTLALTNSGVTKSYDGTTAAPAGFTPAYSYGGLVSGDTGASLSDTGVAYDSAHVASATDVMISGLSITGITGSVGSQATDYTVASSSATVPATITAAPVTVSLSNTTNVTKTYDGTTAAPGGFNPTYSIAGLVAGDSATLSSSAAPVFDSSHVASATAITQGGLSLASVAGNGSDNSVLGDYTLASTTAATGNGVASISPIVLTATAPTIGGTTTKVYDGTTAGSGATLRGGSVSGALSGDTLVLDTSGIALNYDSSHVASASSIRASGSLAVSIAASTNGSQSTDYSVALPAIAAVAGTIAPATLTPTLTNSGVTKVYDGTTAAPIGFAPTYSLAGLAAGDTGATLTNTSAAYNSAHVAGARDVTVSGLGITGITGSNGSLATDYALASSGASVAATITPATLTATLANSGVTKIYDGTTAAPTGFAPTYSYAGLVSGDTGASLNDTGAAYDSSQVLTATDLTVSGLHINGITGSAGSLASDYSLASSSAGVAATITPASLTARLTGSVSKVYDGTATAALTPGNYTLSGFVGGQGATVTQTSGTYNSSGVVNATTVTAALGGGDFTADSGTSLSNYTLPTSASGAASITPAPLVVTANDAGKTYDGAAYSGGNGVTYSGFVNGESASVLSGALAYGGSSQGAVNAGSYTITPAGFNSGNYTINYDSGVLTVSPAMLTARLTGTVSKVYDGTTTAALAPGSYTLTGVIGGDVVSLDGPTAGVYAIANAGSGINVGVSGLAISGSGASNYLLSSSTATAAIGVITPARLVVTANSASTTYDAQAYSGGNGVTYSGFVDGQTATVLNGTLTYGGSSQGALNVGNYALTPGGLASNNYAITYDSGTLAIAPATLTYAATPAQVYAGQAIPPLTGTVTGFQGSDTLSNATTGTLSFTTPATAHSAIGQYAIDGGGLAANDGDYVFVQAAGNALAFHVMANSDAALPGVVYLQQQLGQPVSTATAQSPGGLPVSTTMARADEPATAPPQSAIPPGSSDLYAPDVRVVDGGVRLP